VSLEKQKLTHVLAPPKGPVAKKWSMFVMLGEPGYPQRHTEALFAGAVGGGKSRALAAWLLLRAFSYPGIRLALARDRLTNLKRSTLKTLFEAADGRIAEDSNDYDPSVHFAYWNKRDDIIKFANGSEIHLFGVKDAGALDRLVGTEWGGVAIDQLERIPFNTYVAIPPRVRQYVTHQETGEVVWPMVKATANVTSKRSSWVARHFLYSAPTTPLAAGKLGDDVREMHVESIIDGVRVETYRAYFKVGIRENESLNPHYMHVLAGVASHIGGFLTDEWEEDLEQIFVHEWSNELQVESSPTDDLDAYDLYVGLDWGWGASPTVALYGLWHRTKGELLIDREYVEYGRDIQEYGADISADITDYVNRGVRTVRIFYDPSMDNRTGFGTTAAATFSDIFRKKIPHARIIMAPAFKRGTLPVRSKERVDVAKRLMREKRLYVHRHSAPQVTETLSTVMWGDVTKDRHPVVDIFDAFAYMTMNIPIGRPSAADDPDAMPISVSKPKQYFSDWRY